MSRAVYKSHRANRHVSWMMKIPFKGEVTKIGHHKLSGDGRETDDSSPERVWGGPGAAGAGSLRWTRCCLSNAAPNVRGTWVLAGWPLLPEPPVGGKGRFDAGGGRQLTERQAG